MEKRTLANENNNNNSLNKLSRFVCAESERKSFCDGINIRIYAIKLLAQQHQT